jgi:hypothetical protein
VHIARQQIIKLYLDELDGRCAIGVIMSYFGWNDKDDFRAYKKLLRAFAALTQAGVGKDLVIQLNDSGMSFDEIADYSDQLHELNSIDLVEY